MWLALASCATILLEASNPAWGNPISKGADPLYTQNPFRYRGYYYDEETGFYFLNSRYYDPEVKRFINADCLFLAGDAITGANMYAYCNGNPVMGIDPTGRAGEAVMPSPSTLDAWLWLLQAGIYLSPAAGAIAAGAATVTLVIVGLFALIGLDFLSTFTKSAAMSQEDKMWVESAQKDLEDKNPTFYKATTNGHGKGATVNRNQPMNYIEAARHVAQGGDVWTRNATDAEHLAIVVSGGYYYGSAELNVMTWITCQSGWGGNAKHYHLKGKSVGAHLFYDTKNLTFI